mgnify:CR=1 FL=1
MSFPFLFGGTFIEGVTCTRPSTTRLFPFLFGGTFIEGVRLRRILQFLEHFPSFSEGLSLRGRYN